MSRIAFTIKKRQSLGGVIVSLLSACGSSKNSTVSDNSKNSSDQNISSDTTLYNLVSGTDRDDTLRGTTVADKIQGFDGNDIIRSNTGNDLIEAGNGDDIIYVEADLDKIYGGAGLDTLALAPQATTNYIKVDLTNGTYQFSKSVSAEKGIFTSIENVTVSSTVQSEIIGSLDDNIISTGNGNDTIYTMLGNNKIDTSGGNDTVFVTKSTGEINAGLGIDTLVISSSQSSNATINLSTGELTFGSDNLNFIKISGFEKVELNNQIHGNQIIGNEYDNSIIGSDFNDTIRGALGHDTLSGRDGKDNFVFNLDDFGNDFSNQDLILDFEVGLNGDKILLDLENLIETNTPIPTDINVNRPIVSNQIETYSSVAIRSGSGFLGEVELLSKINKYSTFSNTSSQEIYILAAWFNSMESKAKISLLVDTGEGTQHFEDIHTLISFTAVNEDDLLTLITDNLVLL